MATKDKSDPLQGNKLLSGIKQPKVAFDFLDDENFMESLTEH